MNVNINCNKITVTTLTGQGLDLVEFDVHRTTGSRTEIVAMSLTIPISPESTLRQVQRTATQAAIDLLQSTLDWGGEPD